MTKPLALVFYERLLPGSQLVNRLQDLGYRVEVIERVTEVVAAARKHRPIVLLADLVVKAGGIIPVLREVRDAAETAHVPIIGYADQGNKQLQDEAMSAGATLVAVDDALLPQLPHLLEHALMVE
jgi:PleD family two-component response regulator